MRTVELAPGIRSSALGFGCAPMLGAIDRETALRALNVAFEHGITHFDVARSYGYGEAESLLGRFASGKRDRLVLATKFGIEATRVAGVLCSLKPLIRKALSIRHRASSERSSAPSAQGPALRRVAADRLHRRLSITPELLVRSLETSLRSLKTEYVDYLLVHEPLAPVERIADLIPIVAALKQQGKVRAWGLALLFEQWDLHQDYLDAFDLLQFDNSPQSVHYGRAFTLRADRPNVLFAPFRPVAGGNAPSVTGSHGDILRQMLLDFPRSVVLCSMFNARHIEENVRSVTMSSQDVGS